MRKTSLLLIAGVLVAATAAPAAARNADTADQRAGWRVRIDELVAGRSVSVAVREDGRVLYQHREAARKIPASNEKLLLSMALLDALDPTTTIPTTTATSDMVIGGVLAGDLWLLGRGDPSVTGGGSFGNELPFEPTRIRTLAEAVQDAGITEIDGRVRGAISFFDRDWWAEGWKPNFPADYIALPSALTFDGNTRHGEHIDNPEWLAARSLTRRLEAIGIDVEGKPGAGTPPDGLTPLAELRSAPVETMLRYMNRQSSNFFAEVFCKLLATATGQVPGTIAGGAAAIEAWASANGVTVDAHDGSGLSYANRVSASGVARLLEAAEVEVWGPVLRRTLAGSGEGTLQDRLGGVRIRAKTGTLTNVSTISGWVWLRRRDAWAEFSILTSGMPKSTATDIEDAILRELTRSAS